MSQSISELHCLGEETEVLKKILEHFQARNFGLAENIFNY
jgi:hypothetical protein